MIVNWDEVENGRDLGLAAGTLNVGLRRHRLSVGESVEQGDSATEEIMFVVAGSGESLHRGERSRIRSGDCVVRHLHDTGHSLRAGEKGLTVLQFSSPLGRRAAAGDRPPPPGIVSLESLEADYEGEIGKWVLVARQAGAVRAGLNWGRLEAGHSGAPPHCHSADEEVFVILKGSGTLELWPSPERSDVGRQERELRAGDVISRPPSTGIGHFLRAGEEGMTFLVYGTREPNDICYYPRSNKIYFRGLGLIGRMEPLGYDDGEPEE